MSSRRYDLVVIGGGIVGLATARALTLASRAGLAVLEAEDKLATHQSGHNSGVIHSGLYYRPGSLKARNCTTGREKMYRFCAEHGIPHDNCGKIVIAVSAEELPALDELERRGRANGLSGVERLSPEQLREHEPHAAGVAGLLVPQTGIVDYGAVAEAVARQIRERGGEIMTGARVTSVVRRADGFVLETPAGEVEARAIVNCAGLHSDRLARMRGVEPPVRIVPFRGEYFKLTRDKEHWIRNLIYPVPDPRFPFLGVHFTRMIHGGIEAGPNAVLALKREGYERFSLSLGDALETFSYGGFWRMARRHWRTGVGEVHRSLSKAAAARALGRLVPGLAPADLVRHGAGIRAQAVAPDGSLLDDFCIEESERMLHVLNAPSPGATASLSIGRTLAERAIAAFGL